MALLKGRSGFSVGTMAGKPAWFGEVGSAKSDSKQTPSGNNIKRLHDTNHSVGPRIGRIEKTVMIRE
jgi:hypothetical protein